MSDPSAMAPARLFTAFGTVLYVDVASGELRHGEVESSPANVAFVADPDSAASGRQGWLLVEVNGSREPLRCSPDRSLVASSAQGESDADAPMRLDLIPLERGLIAFAVGDLFLSAFPGGRVSLSAPACSTWELFLASETWCGEVGADDDAPFANDAARNFDRKRIKSYIVHPLNRVRANARPRAKKLLIYGYTKWSHGRVHYDLCTHLHRHGYIVDILDWQVNHADYIDQVVTYYDLFMTALDGVRTLVDSYKIPYSKIIAVSHHEFDIRMLIEQKGIEIFDEFANYGVVSEFLYCASLMRGVVREPMVAPLGVNYAEFYSEVSERLATVGYASSMSTKTFGVEWKRGELAEAAAKAAGLDFKVAGSTGNQISFHDMPEFYRSVDAVLTSSISEAAQLPAIEAAAAGRLVIGTPVGHFPLKAYQGGGILAPVEAEKFKAFAAATLRFYKENPSAYATKCRDIQKAASQFDWQYSIGQWVEFIESARNDLRRPLLPVAFVADPITESALNRLDLKTEFLAIESKGYSRKTELCDIMTRFGSDKGGKYHNYTILYDYLFARFRSERFNIFELGLGTNKIGAPSSMGVSGRPGASLRAWREYFDVATVYGADVDGDILFDEERIHTYWVDQRDPHAIRKLWQQVGADIEFDIIIDDGLHDAPANILFCTESLKKLKSGGFFIIEDIRTIDVETMARFAQAIEPESKGVVFELLGHPLNQFDNRLLIVHKK